MAIFWMPRARSGSVPSGEKGDATSRGLGQGVFGSLT